MTSIWATAEKKEKGSHFSKIKKIKKICNNMHISKKTPPYIP